MRNLIASDLRRVVKDKLLMVVIIVAAAFAVLTPLLYWVLFKGMDAMTVEMLGVGTYAKDLFFTAFNIGNDLGLVAPVLIAVILFKDFSHGTIRNKIIAGKSRTHIFVSTYVTCLIVLFAVTLFYALLTLGVSLLMFPYQEAPFDWACLGYTLGSLLLELNLYLFVAALVSYICVSSRNIGLVLVKYLGISMGVAFVTSALQIAVMAVEVEGNETALKILEFVQNINIYNYVMVIGKGTSYGTKELLFMIFTPLVLTAGIFFLGVNKIRKKDIN